MLAENDAGTTNSLKADEKLGTKVSRERYDRYITSLDGVLIHARPLLRGTIVNRTKILMVKKGKNIGFGVYRRSY